MNAKHLRFGATTTLQLYGAGAQPPSDQLVRLAAVAGLSDEVELSWQNGTWSGRVADLGPDTRYTLERLDSAIGVVVHQQADCPSPGVLVEVHRFTGVVPLAEPLHIGVTEAAANQLVKALGRGARRSMGPDGATVAWACAQLNDEVRLAGLDRPMAVMAGGAASLEGGFRLGGARVHVQVRVDDDGRTSVDKLPRTRGVKLRAVHLLRGEVCFVEDTAAAKLRAGVQAQLDQLQSEASSYQRIWGRYLAREYDLLVEQQEAVGWLRYVDKRFGADGQLLLTIDRAESYPTDADQHATRWPAALPNRALTIAGGLHAGVARPAQLRLNAQKSGPPKTKGKVWSGSATFEGWREDDGLPVVCVAVKEDDLTEVPEEGYLHAPLMGDLRRLERRKAAQEAIMTGMTPMPQLALLLEGQQVAAIKPATRRVTDRRWRELFDGDTPTAAQRAAVQAAVFTPDVAIIQGPPGTGKTKVIAAIVRLLDELEERGRDSHARVLVTSTQHDAVNNAAGRLTLRGVPAVKVGRDEDEDSLRRWREAWLTKLADNCQRLGGAPLGAQRAQEALLACLETGLPPRELHDAVEQVLRQARPHVASSLIAAVRSALRKDATALKRSDSGLRARLRAAVSGLSGSPVAFADGGNRQAERALAAVDAASPPMPLPSDQRALLERMAALGDGVVAAEPDLTALAALRQRLLRQLRPARRVTLVERLNGDAAVAMEAVMTAWRAAETRQPRAKVTILQALHDDLSADPDGVKDLLLGYTTALAATCQQAASRRMSQARELGAGDDLNSTIRFDSVIVDEAARVDPLDLQIPLAQAKRRIVLVGDHRQLPHMLEPKIHEALLRPVSLSDDDPNRDSEEPDVEESNADEPEGASPSSDPAGLDALERQALQESLFQRLIRNARKMEQRDGQPRVVALDRQYRMHPRLGALVSRHFYEQSHGPGDPGIVLASGLSADFQGFQHGLPGFCDASGEPLQGVWISVPHQAGHEYRPDRSWLREVEAARVAQTLIDVLEGSNECAVGVISFYSAQVQAIWRALRRRGYAEYADEVWQLAGEVAETPTGGRRQVRIGTIDAFQGLEFDVVVLSFTRSNRRRVRKETEWPHRFGHLLSRHRRCVAISRQKALLVVVGDAAMVADDVGAVALPDLHAFHRYCKEGRDGFALQQ